MPEPRVTYNVTWTFQYSSIISTIDADDTDDVSVVIEQAAELVAEELDFDPEFLGGAGQVTVERVDGHE